MLYSGPLFGIEPRRLNALLERINSLAINMSRIITFIIGSGSLPMWAYNGEKVYKNRTNAEPKNGNSISPYREFFKCNEVKYNNVFAR